MTENKIHETFPVTHLNIRESISFMLLKLFVLELLFAFLTLFVCFPLACIEFPFITLQSIMAPYNLVFILFTGLKLFLVMFVILDWLNEYYEILPTKIVHRRGVIFKHEEEYVYSHIMSVDFQRSFLGEVFNYGTIHLYDRYINKHIYLYLIHNPQKYFQILKELIPVTDTEREAMRI